MAHRVRSGDRLLREVCATVTMPPLPAEPLTVSHASAVFARLAPLYGASAREAFVVLTLDTQNKLRDLHVLSVGTLDASLVHPRDVFRPAILASAAAIIISHNHPSGNAEPSPQDIELTKRLVAAGKILDIAVLDHVIIGEGRYVSLHERGII